MLNKNNDDNNENVINQKNMSAEEDDKFNFFYESTFHNISTAIVWFDLKGKIFHINPHFIKMFGYQRDEVLGKPISSIITVEGDKKLFFSQILKGERIENPIKLLHKNKQTISVIVISAPLFINHDMIGGFLILSDISVQRQAEERARERESRLHTLLDKSRIGFVIISQEHRIIETNKRFAEMLGYSLPEMFQLHTWDWEADMNEKQIREAFGDLSKIDQVFETRHQRKDGTVYDVEISATGTYVNGYKAILCICQDISARKQVEKALKESEIKFRSFVENANDIIFAIDEIGIIKYMSPNIENLCGYKKTETEKKSVFSFIHPSNIKSLKQFIKQSFRLKKIRKELEFRFKHADRSWNWYALNASLSEDENHHPILLCIARNISERKQYEEQLMYLSLHDPLTGLYNRNFYDDEIERLEKDRRKYPISFLACDLDGLKAVNDKLGHHMGDTLIKDCANIIKDAVRDSDFIVRIGGDEFVIILPKTNEEKAAVIIKRIKQGIDSYNEKSQFFQMSISIGLATTSKENQSLTQILRNADKNMYLSKAMKETPLIAN